MNIAAMNVRICFQKSSVVTDEIGNHTNEWVDYFSCYATVCVKCADDPDTAWLAVTSERMDFTVRYCSETAAVTSTGFRIMLGSRIYNIRSIDNMAFKNKSLKMHGKLERR